jgi:outer membrane protein assembly factor BamD (BamD/ComL family)
MAGFTFYLNSDFKNALSYYKKIPASASTNEDLVYLAYLSYLTETSFCDIFSRINFERLKNDEEILKKSIKKYKILRKECK